MAVIAAIIFDSRTRVIAVPLSMVSVPSTLDPEREQDYTLHEPRTRRPFSGLNRRSRSVRLPIAVYFDLCVADVN
jgi:hypothetical protein